MFGAGDIELGPELLALIPVENAQRKIDAEPDVGGVAVLPPEIDAERRIGGSIGLRKPVVRMRLIHALKRRAQIGAGGDRDGAKILEGIDFFSEIERPGDVERIDRSAV